MCEERGCVELAKSGTAIWEISGYECTVMIGEEVRITRVRATVAPLRKTAIDEGIVAYLYNLGNKEYPGQPDIAAARDAAEYTIKQRILSPEWLSAMMGGKPVAKEDAAGLRLSFDAVVPHLTVPAPQDASELSPVGLGIAAVVGAVGGMMVLTPLARLLLDMRDTGLFVGAPLGAFLLVLATCHAANSNRLRRILVTAFAVAAIGEVWVILTGGGLLSRVWRQLGGRRSGVQRILLYVCVIFVLLFAKRHPRYDRKGHEETIRSAIEQWLDGAIVAASALLGPGGPQEGTKADREEMLYSLVGKVQLLEQTPPENLQPAVQELLQEVRRIGFVWDTAKTFRWEEAMHKVYDTFGHVEPGDLVIAEREPISFDGAVRVRGLVRKVRDGG